MKKRIVIGAIFMIITFALAMAGHANANELPASSVHNILSSQLPQALLADVKKDYSDYWITGLYEEGNVKHPSYYITLENPDQVITMSSDDSENWFITNTTLKNN
jgi:hypothetical protein